MCVLCLCCRHAYKDAIYHRRSVQGTKSLQEGEGKSFTDVILRLTGSKGSARRLLEMMDEMHSPELADSIEQASKEFRKNFKTRGVDL